MAVYQIGGYHLTLELVRQILQDTDARVELPAEITRLAQMNGSTMTQAVAVTVFLRFSGLLPQCLPRLPAQRTRAIQETVDWIGQILERENNITCDNPLLFETDNGQFEAVMGCNCSNTQVGYAMDLLSTLMAELGRGLMKQGSPAILWQRLATLAMQVSGDSPHQGRPGGPCGVQLHRRRKGRGERVRP